MIKYLKIEKGKIWHFTFTLSEDGCFTIYYPGTGADMEEKQTFEKEEVKALLTFLQENQERFSP